MNEGKAQLLKFLDFIEELSNEPGNEWLKIELGKRYALNRTNEENEMTKAHLSFESFVRLQKNIFRMKAYEFYKNIHNTTLKNELTKDFIEMSWYKMINNIERYFMFAFYQLENMLNFYILRQDAYSKIIESPASYTFAVSESTVVKCHSCFFDQKGNPIDVSKINSNLAKLVFWAICSGNVDWFSKNKQTSFNLMNIRNLSSHRNSQGKADNTRLIETINSLKRGDDSNLTFTTHFLKRVASTII